MWWFFGNKPVFKKYNWTEITIHHSATADGQMVNWQAIRKYHIETMGWDDVAYHYGLDLINDQYEILMGRPLNMNGAHTAEAGVNYRSIGICCIGDFDKVAPSDQLLKKLAVLVRSLQDQFGIKTENIKGHRDYASYKSCPGKLFDLDVFKKDYLGQIG